MYATCLIVYYWIVGQRVPGNGEEFVSLGGDFVVNLTSIRLAVAEYIGFVGKSTEFGRMNLTQSSKSSLKGKTWWRQ